jgi:hypothetical protein
MSNQKWIMLHGMVTVEQAEYLASVLSVGNDPFEDNGPTYPDLVANIEDQLRKAIGHIRDAGCSGSGIVVEGNRFLEPLAEPHTYADEQDRANGVDQEPLAT